jgi:hypothetical protein
VHDITVAHKLIRPDDKAAGGDSGYVGLEERDEMKHDPLMHTPTKEQRSKNGCIYG